MKPTRTLILVSLFAGIAGLPAYSALGNVERTDADTGRWALDLNGYQWQMQGIRPGQGEKEGWQHLSTHGHDWNGAKVPGDVYTDLWRAGAIDDPYFGRNSMKATWPMELEWWYRRDFEVPMTVKGKNVRLVFQGVDYACDVWLNGKHLGRHEGMFSAFEFDVSSVLRYGNWGHNGNVLDVRLDPPPRNYSEVAGRKYDWEGDYWRQLTPMGIWQPVGLVATGPLQIQDVHPVSHLHDDGSATIDVGISIASHGDSIPEGARVRAVVRGANFESARYSAEATVTGAGPEEVAQLSLKIPQAKLWWPWDMGAPNLYTIETSITDPSGNLWDRAETRLGIREIHMERNPGYSTDQVKYPWTMIINGKPEFLRSATWGGPPDIFYGRTAPGKYRKLVELAKAGNINNLRIFGWHPTEVEQFYDLCDELGITVWQDLIPLASVSVPQDDAFRIATYAEAVAVIKRLRIHPCLVLLEGGEESFHTWDTPQGAEYTAGFLLGLEQVIRPYTDLPYVPTSPLSRPHVLKYGLGGPKDSQHTHGVFYSIGAVLIEDDVKKWDYAVIPEFGVTSVPNVESVRRFIPPDELWPPGPSWGFHWADLDELRNVNYQVFGDERTGSLQEFAEATQIAQGTIFQFGIEHIRRRKPKSSAISICHFNSFAPDMKWGIVDYFGLPKRSYDFVKRAYQPLLASLEFDQRRWLPGEEFTGKLWIVNDLARNYTNCALTATLSDAAGKKLSSQTHPIAVITADSSEAVAAMDWKVDGRLGQTFRVTLSLVDAGGQVLSANYYDLLVGDEAKARPECARRAAQFQATRGEFSQADYYRYFPGLLDPERMGDQPPPTAPVQPSRHE